MSYFVLTLQCLRPYYKETNCRICRKRAEDESEGSEHSEHGLVMDRWSWPSESFALKRLNISYGQFPVKNEPLHQRLFYSRLL
jgi:hypothetical protein